MSHRCCEGAGMRATRLRWSPDSHRFLADRWECSTCGRIEHLADTEGTPQQ